MDTLIAIASYFALFVFGFLPSIFAFISKHNSRWTILVVNSLLNGVGIGWIVGWALFFTLRRDADGTPEDPSLSPRRSGVPQLTVGNFTFGPLSILLRTVFTGAATAATTYSMSTLGPGFWSLTILGIGVSVLVTLVVPILDPVMILLGISTGVLSGIMLVLLLAAATIGGSFHMSDGDVILAYLLGLLSISGISALFWGNRMERDRGN